MKENREIRTVLKLANSDKNRTIDIQDTERLVDLIDNLDMYSAQADAEEARIKELDAEVQILLPEMFTLSSSFTFVKRVQCIYVSTAVTIYLIILTRTYIYW